MAIVASWWIRHCRRLRHRRRCRRHRCSLFVIFGLELMNRSPVKYERFLFSVFNCFSRRSASFVVCRLWWFFWFSVLRWKFVSLLRFFALIIQNEILTSVHQSRIWISAENSKSRRRIFQPKSSSEDASRFVSTVRPSNIRSTNKT